LYNQSRKYSSWLQSAGLKAQFTFIILNAKCKNGFQSLGKQDIAQELILMCNHLERNTFLLQKETKNNTLLTQGLTICTAEMLQLSFTSLQGVPLGNEKMRLPILLTGSIQLQVFTISFNGIMQLLVQDTKRYYHHYSDTLDNDMTIKEMYFFIFMQFKQVHIDTMKSDIY
jgi:hypothetical protein